MFILNLLTSQNAWMEQRQLGQLMVVEIVQLRLLMKQLNEMETGRYQYKQKMKWTCMIILIQVVLKFKLSIKIFSVR